MEKTIATYLIDGHKVDIVACSDGENAEGEVEFYDFWKRENDSLGADFDTHLNLGDPWYPETGEGTPPTVEEVAGYLRSQLPLIFPGTGPAEVYETERTYRVVVLCTVTDEKKDENDRGELGDEEYVSAEVQWVDTSFSGMEIVSLEKVPPPGSPSLETAPESGVMDEAMFRELVMRGDIFVKVGKRFRLINSDTDTSGAMVDRGHNLYAKRHDGKYTTFFMGPKGDY